MFLLFYATGRRITVWSESSDDLHGKHKGSVIGMFDSYGNGVVYDERGNIRYAYNLSFILRLTVN